MEHTPALSLNVELKDRVLWFDGQSSFKSSNLLNTIQRYNVKYVDKITPEVEEYNKLVSTPQQEIKVKTSCDKLTYDWAVPAAYANLDIINYIFNLHDIIVVTMSTEEIKARERRLLSEILAMEKRDLMDVIRALIFVINTLTTHNVVWGVGRGSSVSSYVLYVLGVHDVDSYAYNLDIDDFLHD